MTRVWLEDDTNNRVLIVDDSEDFLELASHFLAQNASGGRCYQTVTAQNEGEALRMVKSFRPDIVVIDVNLEKSSGLDLCKKIRALSTPANYIGLILISSQSTPKTVARGLELGADDFCSKRYISAELVPRINAVLRIKEMTDSLQAANDKLRSANSRLAKITITDDLSKLYNMRYFKRRLNQEFIRGCRYKKDLSLIMFDVDNFKEVNDSCDHLMGSFVLAEVGAIVKNLTRSVDIAARYGGDEYVILLPETGFVGARTFADRLLAKISEHEFEHHPYKAKITISAGVVAISADDQPFSSSVEMLRQADKYLYAAKEAGRACVIDKTCQVSLDESA